MGAWMIGTRKPSRAVRGVEIVRMGSKPPVATAAASIRAAPGAGKAPRLQSPTDRHTARGELCSSWSGSSRTAVPPYSFAANYYFPEAKPGAQAPAAK
jgi:hypothetical protein